MSELVRENCAQRQNTGAGRSDKIMLRRLPPADWFCLSHVLSLCEAASMAVLDGSWVWLVGGLKQGSDTVCGS